MRYYKKPLLQLSDAELGRETYIVEWPDAGNLLAWTPRDEKLARHADFEHMRSRLRGEEY